MGQSQASEMMKQVQLHPDSASARGQLWNVFTENDQKKSSLEEPKACEFFKTLYEVLKKQDLERPSPSKSWSSEAETVLIWLEAYEVKKNGFLTRDNFDLALGQFKIEAKIDETHRSFKLEEDWEVVEENVCDEKEVLRLTLSQLKSLIKAGDKYESQGRWTKAKFQYESSITILNSLLRDKSHHIAPLKPELQSKMFSVQRKLYSIECQVGSRTQLIPVGADRKTVTFKTLPLDILGRLCLHLDGRDRQSLSVCCQTTSTRLSHVIPVINYIPFEQILWDRVQQQIEGKFSYLMWLPSELHIIILSQLQSPDLLTIKGTSSYFRKQVIQMFVVEWEAMHLTNFIKLKDELQTTRHYEKDAVDVSDSIADGLFEVGLRVLPEGRGVGAVVGLCIMGVAGLMKLEAWCGGPVSGSIGKAVEYVEMKSKDTAGPAFAINHCMDCEREFAFFDAKNHCRCCKKVFCARCCGNEVMIPIRNQRSYNVQVCNACFKIVDTNYAQLSNLMPTIQPEDDDDSLAPGSNPFEESKSSRVEDVTEEGSSSESDEIRFVPVREGPLTWEERLDAAIGNKDELSRLKANDMDQQ